MYRDKKGNINEYEEAEEQEQEQDEQEQEQEEQEQEQEQQEEQMNYLLSCFVHLFPGHPGQSLGHDHFSDGLELKNYSVQRQELNKSHIKDKSKGRCRIKNKGKSYLT